MNIPLILASQSPRRKELLAQLGYQFTTHSADIDESILADEPAAVYVERLAIAKARKVAELFPEAIVLGSDTSVVINSEILGKPADEKACMAMLTKLSDTTHQVMTSIAGVYQDKVESHVSITNVTFKGLTAQEISNYWQTSEPIDKAGAYGIQGIGGQFVTQIQGCYFSVVGLPLYQTAQLLAKFGLTTPIQAIQKES